MTAADGLALDLVRVPSGLVTIGTSVAEAEACVRDWADRLIDPDYTESQFREWIAKEVPSFRVPVRSFLLGRTPVTNGSLGRFLEAQAGSGVRTRIPDSIVRGEPDDRPVWGVGYSEASAYCTWLGDRHGKAFRLPTEFEWEWAARGPARTVFPYGDRFDPRRANTIESRRGGTTPVGEHPDGASWCGALDLAGNVEEWTSSWFAPYPGGRLVEDDLHRSNPLGYRVLRGGAWCLGGDASRSARRHGPIAGARFVYRGFRVAVDLDSSDGRLGS